MKNHVMTYILFVAYFLTACSAGPQISNGDVINLYHSTAAWIIDGCLSGECASHIYVKDNLVVYARPFVENVAFVITSKGIPVDKLTGVTGNLVNCATWQDFQNWLLSNGFSVVSTAAPFYRMVVDAAVTISTMELLPVFSIMLTPAELPEWVAPETSSE